MDWIQSIKKKFVSWMDRMDFVMDGSDGYGFHGSNCHPYPKAKTKKSELHYKN